MTSSHMTTRTHGQLIQILVRHPLAEEQYFGQRSIRIEVFDLVQNVVRLLLLQELEGCIPEHMLIEPERYN